MEISTKITKIGNIGKTRDAEYIKEQEKKENAKFFGLFLLGVFTLQIFPLQLLTDAGQHCILVNKNFFMRNTKIKDDYYDNHLIMNTLNNKKTTKKTINSKNKEISFKEFSDNCIKNLNLNDIIKYLKQTLYYKVNIVETSNKYRIFNYYDEVFKNGVIDFNVLKSVEKIYLIQDYTRNDIRSECFFRGVIKKIENYLLQNKAIETEFVEKYDTGNCLYFEVYINPDKFFNLLSLIYYNGSELRYGKKHIRIEGYHKKLIDYFLDKQNADMIDVENYVFSNHKIIQRLGYFIDDEKIKNLLKNINKTFKELCYPTSFFTLNTGKIIKKINYIEDNVFTK